MKQNLAINPYNVNEYMSVVGYRLLILPDVVETETESGIIMQTDYDGSMELERAFISSGTVVSIGPMAWKGIKGYSHDAGGNWCEIGDHVKYSKYSGKFIFDPFVKDANEKNGMLKYALVNDEDIQCVLDDTLIEKYNSEYKVEHKKEIEAIAAKVASTAKEASIQRGIEADKKREYKY